MKERLEQLQYACAAIEERGYTVLEVKSRFSSFRSNKEMYSIWWAPACFVPWSRTQRYKTNQVFGPSIDTIIQKVKQLPFREA